MESLESQDTKFEVDRNDRYTSTYSPIQRLAMAGVAIGLAILLVTAGRLTPNPAGLGTHQQLGLPPCSSLVIFGVRCPACGMTTSWALLLDGDILNAVRVNTGGVMLALIAAVGVLCQSLMAWSGRREILPWFMNFVLWSLIAALSVAVLQWLLRFF